MCILCVIQRWSRGVATMLPWLVIPLIGLWALSQLLPPAFRFEITSPRLACVFVLLVTLFWYEVLMPQLSAWRVRRNARLRERRRFEAIELQKLRKTATRRCRNCLTPYKDQNPGGGRFMCSYCGHISKRPILDLPVPPGISNSGIIKELVGKSGKILNGKGWSDNGGMCGQDWLENENWANGSFAGKSGYWHKNGSGFFLGDEPCLAENSYPGVLVFAGKLLSSFFLSLRWVWRKISRLSSQGEDESSDAENRGLLAKRGDNGANDPASRTEKARRKAEEKRQARLERELLEEEERKQREEVARLVEERRRLRDEKMEIEKLYSKRSLHVREKDSKKEAEKKRQEGRREKDRGSSKSNFDADEIERKAGMRDSDKSENDKREYQKSGTESLQGQGIGVWHGTKNISTNFSRGSAGSRYLDRMKGTLLSSSKAFSGSSFFGKVANVPATAVKENKSNSSVDNRTAVHKKDLYPPEHLPVKSNISGDDKCINRPVLLEPHQRTEPKKSWQQLFTRASPIPPSTSANVISRPNAKSQAEVQNPPPAGQPSSVQSFDNPVSFGLPSPFTLPNYPNGSSSSGFSPPIEPIFTCMGQRSRDLPEETELFEDPCYVPDPTSLLGPVSESLDNFQLDLGIGFATDMRLERLRALSHLSASTGVNRPSPIKSPISRLRVADEKYSTSNRSPNTSKDQDMNGFPAEDVMASDKGTWQMWSSSPLGHDSLGLVGGPVSWLLPSGGDKLTKEDFVHPPSQKNVTSLFANEDQVLPGTHSSQNVFLGNAQSSGTFSSITSPSRHDPWLQNAFLPPLSSSENDASINAPKRTTQNEMIYGTPSRSATNHPFEAPQDNCWSKKEWGIPGSEQGPGKSSVARPHIGGLFPTTDVQSLW